MQEFDRIKVDLTGQKFGNLTVIKFDGFKFVGNRERSHWICKCDCGNERSCEGALLKFGNIKSCGCLAHQKLLIPRNDLTGKRFGRLFVVEFSHFRESVKDGLVHRTGVWKCICDCGQEKNISGNNLTTKTRPSKSCGCLKAINCGVRCPPGVANENAYYGRYEYEANKRNFEFILTREQFLQLAYNDCYYCGKIPSTVYKKHKSGDIIVNGIDRKDNNEGYTIENCVPCCSMCNQIKWDTNLDDLYKHIEVMLKTKEKRDKENAKNNSI